MTLIRKYVYETLDEERDYQDLKWGTDERPTVGNFLVYMQDYMTQAIHDLTHNIGDEKALDTIRKITALGVACMEQNGSVRRQQ